MTESKCFSVKIQSFLETSYTSIRVIRTPLIEQKNFLFQQENKNHIKYSDAIANPAAKNVTSNLFI
jgi:hypothetical protein